MQSSNCTILVFKTSHVNCNDVRTNTMAAVASADDGELKLKTSIPNFDLFERDHQYFGDQLWHRRDVIVNVTMAVVLKILLMPICNDHPTTDFA